MDRKLLKNSILTAMFLAIGVVLPLITSQIKEIGDSLLPMHIPVLLCGMICGAKYGMAVGFILPFLRSILFSMPPLYPNAIWMALEMATYGLMIGIFYSRYKTIRGIYLSLALAMMSGRIVWGISKALLLGFSGKIFTFAAFVSGGFIDAFPGIILQFLLIPSIMLALSKTKSV